MMDHEFDDRIEEYVEGTLAADLIEEMEAHLAACGRCRSAVDTLRSILDEAPRLPRSIEPEHDLWPDISTRLEAAAFGETVDITPRSPVQRSHRRPPSSLMLAAAAVVLLTMGVSWWTSRSIGTGTPQDPLIVAASTSLIEEFESAESAYLDAAAVLEASYRLERARLADETAETIDRNLEILDTAIDEVRATVAANPRDPEALDHLAATYRNKVEVLRRLTRISAGDPEAPGLERPSPADTDPGSP